MSAKVVFIGAGSLGFTRGLVRDILTFPTLHDAHIVLVDIDPERLRMAKASCARVISAGKYPARLTATTDRKKALAGADAVLTTILCGDVDTWQHDILIPREYGVDINVGDTRGPSGIFRALRTIPEMIAICRDIEALCPDALMLNYTNPMAMLCQAMQKTTAVNVTGLCHSVQGTARMLAGWAGVPYEEVDYVCGGINHLAWYLSFTHKGRDLYPALRRKVREDAAVYNAEQVRNELFLAFDYYVTESSGHNSEYNWWFRKRPELIEKYCTHGTNWNPGHHAYILNEYRKRTHWKQDVRKWIDNPDWDVPAKRKAMLKRGEEYASSIIDAWLGGDLFRFNGNVLNTGNLVGNLPADCCVEVPVLASRRKMQPIAVGDLPRQVVPLTSLNATCETLAVEAALEGDPRKVYQAVASDPLTAAVLSLAEIRDMVNAMLAKNKPHLPQFKRFKA
ncbi:MAG: alpha-galactosidase [Kiritimatiellae bacterium]|jgi:alpha-galactosidase|nr:alpha-galactosidase [Kiritimatiellia bacterium]NLE42011.1 alpha-galactosidase [Lentisphaerota bacterium]